MRVVSVEKGGGLEEGGGAHPWVSARGHKCCKCQKCQATNGSGWLRFWAWSEQWRLDGNWKLETELTHCQWPAACKNKCHTCKIYRTEMGHRKELRSQSPAGDFGQGFQKGPRPSGRLNDKSNISILVMPHGYPCHDILSIYVLFNVRLYLVKKCYTSFFLKHTINLGDVIR